MTSRQTRSTILGFGRTGRSKIKSIYAQLHNTRTENRELRRTVAALETEIERLRLETFTDPLTGLYNRTGMRHMWSEVAPEVTGVMVADSDHFKQVNDRYGHGTGDIVICYLAEALRSSGAIAARTGGDEFIGLITDPDPQMVAERLRKAVDVPRYVNGHETNVTVTIGLCLVDQAQNPMGLIDILEKADEALYRGKRAGRNNVTTTR